jgi:hypothetical protein
LSLDEISRQFSLLVLEDKAALLSQEGSVIAKRITRGVVPMPAS